MIILQWAAVTTVYSFENETDLKRAPINKFATEDIMSGYGNRVVGMEVGWGGWE